MSESSTCRLWTVADAADYLQLPISAIYKMTAPKAPLRIPHVRLAGRLRFRQADLDAWLDLLTVSNLDTLRTMQHTSRKVRHGDDPQTETGER